MDIVTNASPLILLDKINRLRLFNSLYDTVYIPSAVLQEINQIGKPTIDLSSLYFQPLNVANQLAVLGLLGRLHNGEVEVMIGAIEQNIQTVVLDDNAARNKAKQLGLEVTGTLGILLEAYKKGLIDDLKQEIVNLKSAGMFLSDEIIKKIMYSQGLCFEGN